MTILPQFFKFSRKADDTQLKANAALLSEQYSLSGEETELIIALMKGMSIKNIALEQKLTQSTVEHRFNSIYRKCGVSSRQSLLAKLK